MDQNNPARFLDTAYNALKANPNATGQILQAAAQGQPVGLRGLAAAAAQQNQQEAQKAAMAQNIRGPQPSVIQQLAGASGIMGQLPSNMQLASAPTGPAPEEMPPQMMAGGGLVAFAGGGNVLPPDVIDAIQSHFAEGGDVRGFPVGGPVEMEDDILRKIFAGGRETKHLEQSERMRELFSQNEDDIIRRALESDLRADEIRRAMGLARNQAVGTAETFDPYSMDMPTRGTGEAGPMVSRTGASAYPYHPTPEPPQLTRPITPETADPIRNITANAYERASKFPLGSYAEPYEVPVGPLQGKIPANAEESIYNLRARVGIPELPEPEPRINAAVGGDTDPISNITREAYAKANRFPLGSYAEPYEVQVSARPGILPGTARSVPQIDAPSPKAPLSMAEKMAQSSEAPVSEMAKKLAKSVRQGVPEVPDSWTSGAADEAFNFGRLSELVGKLPEGVKATGRLLQSVSPYAWALDPRVRAAAKLSTGAGKGDVKDILEGMGEMRSSDSSLEGLDWLVRHGIAPEMGDRLGALLGFAYGGEVRGYAGGDLIKSLTGQSESPGMGLLKRAAGLFTPDVNEAISREEFDASRAASAQKEKDMATLDQFLENYPRESAPKKSVFETVTAHTWQADPDPHTGTPAVPKVPVHEAGTKLYKTFDQAKVDTGTKTTDKDIATSGLNALAPGMDMEKMRDLIMGLGGHKELSPELSQQLGELKDSARTSTILQSILGGLGGGLTDPYGGRFALGRAALGALGGYQKGIGSEEEIGRKAFDILRGYADAPEEEKTKARDLLFGQLSKSAELESEERRAALRGNNRLSLEEWIARKQAERELGPNLFQQIQMTEKQQLARDRASDNAMKDIKDENERRAKNVMPELTLAEKEAIIKQHFAMQGVPYIGGLGAQQSAGQSGGLGGGPLVLK